MAEVEIYTKDWCPYCHGAKALLEDKGIEFAEIDVTQDEAQEAVMRTRSARRTVPQVFIDGVHVGGFDDLVELDRAGALYRSRLREEAAA